MACMLTNVIIAIVSAILILPVIVKGRNVNSAEGCALLCKSEEPFGTGV